MAQPLTDNAIRQFADEIRGLREQNYLSNTHLRLVESNRRVGQMMESERIKRDAGFFKESIGIDPYDPKVLHWERIFSSSRAMKDMREASYRISSRMRQAFTAESTFGQLLRAGVQQIANENMQRVETTYKAWVTEVASDKYGEWYAPLDRVGIPHRMKPGENYHEVPIKGLDQFFVNEKFGAMVSIQRELIDDDLTNQIKQRAISLGEGMPYVEEAWSYLRFIGAATTFNGDVVPAAETPSDETNGWPWSTAFVNGGGANRPSYYGRLTRANLINADIGLFNQLDRLGNKLLVSPNTVIHSGIDKFDARVLLESDYMPSEVSGTAGATGGTFSKNVLKGEYAHIASRFMPTYAWALGEAGKGFYFQRRDPTEVVQENPQSGPPFSQDVFRYKTRARWIPIWVHPWFWWLGDDGSVSS